MAINLNNFVNVKITQHISSVTTSSRDTAVLLWFGANTSQSTIYNKIINCESSDGTVYLEAYNSEDTTVSKLTIYKNGSSADSKYYYFKTFFDNGGKKLKLIEISESANDTNIKSAVDKLKMEEVVVASNATESEMYSFLKNLTPDTSGSVEHYYNRNNGIEQKIFLSHMNWNSSEIPSGDNKREFSNYFLKHGVSGIEMSLAAYLTNVNVDNANTVKDYAFTSETIADKTTTSGEETFINVSDDDVLVSAMIKNNFNIDGVIVNGVRNLGGNDTKGNDIVNQYMLILLHQTLTERLMNLLTTKIRYSSASLTIVSAAINKELERYVANGYLSTDKIWTDDDLVYNGYTIVKKNTPLINGYIYFILPLSSMTPSQMQEHALPDIYILISDGISIRKIKITGEVF